MDIDQLHSSLRDYMDSLLTSFSVIEAEVDYYATGRVFSVMCKDREVGYVFIPSVDSSTREASFYIDDVKIATFDLTDVESGKFWQYIAKDILSETFSK